MLYISFDNIYRPYIPLLQSRWQYLDASIYSSQSNQDDLGHPYFPEENIYKLHVYILSNHLAWSRS